MDILHITAHMGGGVGKILYALCTADKHNHHRVLCMEPTKNPHFYNMATESRVEIFQYDENTEELLEWADIVQVEWWHNPSVTRYMVEKLSGYAIRLMIWSHISGCTYPRLPFQLIKSVDKFAFTSACSFENPSFNEAQKEWMQKYCKVIPSAGSNFDFDIDHKAHRGFRIGYVGFLGYSKLHRDFVEYCKNVADIPDIRFIIVGEQSYGKELLQDIKTSGIASLFEIKGYRQNVVGELSTMDVFGYLLYPQHTGTTENALLEAMTAGVVPIVLNQGCEKHIVENGKTGLVVNSIEDYRKAVYFLYAHPKERLQMARQAKSFVQNHYNLDNTTLELNTVYKELLKIPKTSHDLARVFGRTPYEWFCSCYAGDLQKVDGLAICETKGSLMQYARQFPCDSELQKCLERNRNKDGRDKMQL